ncbi:MAG: NAD(P)H-hydrate dehydratase [Candidatus Kapabacteria bacterium]|nr:NAD(P)H-hydrate dehydratase [Candidatus Kapabacteria bacterium]MCS7169563.1 NAD(P)H-hydrate dehydratase [Candidatus Kapabacteria bacterium]MDW7997800.1 NAD(P)H-hydrate dehydratase [Bacteroidota bacterium]MDW8225056.1 NAD(P)H-hydrate dehydratase [Bacteroidota bacterium]
MLPILTPDQMRRADTLAIEQGVPSALLMENAARSAADILERWLGEKRPNRPTALIACGSGNNGGDGFALARHLTCRGWKVHVWWTGARERMSPETATNLAALEGLRISTVHIPPGQFPPLPPPADLVVDALLGVGSRPPLRDDVLTILRILRSLPARHVAIDIPTGLNAETGEADPEAFCAELTITMFALKTGLLLNEGWHLCGQIEVASLGVPHTLAAEQADTWILEWSDVQAGFPVRRRISTKFDYGRVGIVAGSAMMAGAAALAANAAIRSGAGLVYLYTAGRIHSAVSPEIIARQLPSTPEGWLTPEALPALQELLERVDTLVVGPGTGIAATPTLHELLQLVPERLPTVIDADALRTITPESCLPPTRVLTPHIGEFSRMTGESRENVSRRAPWLARHWAQRWGGIVLLKHVPTIITDGQRSYWNCIGNPGMATAGSGDVLAGIIGALLARGLPPLQAAAFAAFLHGAAGDQCLRSSSAESLTASALLDALPSVLPQPAIV